jgi:hypothetical protein
MKESLLDRVRRAILELLDSRPEGRYQEHWGGLVLRVRESVPDAAPEDVRLVLKELWGTPENRLVRLAKPSQDKYEAEFYSGDEQTDGRFFYMGLITVTLTDAGRIHLKYLQELSPTNPIGFRP